MLSKTHAFLFIHVPKTGGNALQTALLPFSDDQMALLAPHHDGVDRFEIRSPSLDIHKHSTLDDYRRQLDPDLFQRLTKITCVRNPWDRCVSFFFSPHRGQVTWSATAFEDFIRGTVQPHAHYLALDGQTSNPFDHMDVVLRFENLDADFADLCLQLGVAAKGLQRVNVSRREDYRSYFTSQSLIDLVNEKFEPEIMRFGYDF